VTEEKTIFFKLHSRREIFYLEYGSLEKAAVNGLSQIGAQNV
jgi:hypothetical protein